MKRYIYLTIQEKQNGIFSWSSRYYVYGVWAEIAKQVCFSITRNGKTASKLAHSLKIPLSSVYKKISDLEELTLIEVEKTILSDKGRRFKVYKSRINKAEISIKKPEPTLSLSSNWFLWEELSQNQHY